MYRYGQARPVTSLPLIRTCGAQRGILPCGRAASASVWTPWKTRGEPCTQATSAHWRSITDTQGSAEGSDLPYVGGGVATVLGLGQGPTLVLSYKTKRCLF